jgi:hypothetical protein
MTLLAGDPAGQNHLPGGGQNVNKTGIGPGKGEFIPDRSLEVVVAKCSLSESTDLII